MSLVVVVTLLVLGIGVGVGASPAGASSNAQEASDVLTPPLRAWLDERGPIRLGWPEFPPLASADDSGGAAGYGVDTWDLAATQLGVEIEHVVVGTITDVVAAYRAGEVDAIGGAGVRDDLVDDHRTTPYAWPPTGIVTSPARVGSLPPDLAGTTVTSVPGSPFEAAVPSLFPAAQVVATPDAVEGLVAVANGEVDAFYGPYPLIGALRIDQALDLVPFGDTAEVGGVGVSGVAPPGSPTADVLDAMRSTLSGGQLALVQVRWTGFDMTDPASRGVLPAWLRPVVIVLAVASLLLASFVLFLRRRVHVATTALRVANDELEERVERRTADLARSNNALRRFSSTAAHDLKGPLTAITGLATTLGARDLSAEKQGDLLDRIATSALRLGTMIDVMLTDAVAIGVGPSAVSGAAFARWLRDVCATEVAWAGATLDVDVADLSIDADVEVLRRAAVNLVGNAAKYAVVEGGATIRVALVRLSDQWRLTVEDDGPGVPVDQREAVFERGNRLVADGRGFGLGLTAVRDLVDRAGGTIRIGHSELHGGAAVFVTVPVVDVVHDRDAGAVTDDDR